MNKNVCAAALAASLCAWSASPAGAQSLALSYKLSNAESESTKQALIAINRCAGFNWIGSLGACGRELVQRILPGQPQDGARNEAEPARDAQYKGEEPAPVVVRAVPPEESIKLPTLGLLPERAGKDALSGNAKAVDVMFRFGSKYRFRSNEEGWEWHRFTEAGYDTRMQMNAHKAAGIELMVPLQ
ncbi:MAG: hypothetical protein ACXWUH_07235 [Burkholderiales bacterium]